ncbi:MAG: 3-deoxy-8-phosphooctulonate synthase [Ignavibacteriaceae bacterium]
MIRIDGIEIGDGKPVVLIAGPCVVEGREITFETAEAISRISQELDFPFIFKSSFKKANRTSVDSFTGLGDQEAISILFEVRNTLNLPVLTDIHSPEDIDKIGDAADIIQIPAFLSRQTELLKAAGRSGKIVNIKKGQFLAPDEIKYAAEKVASTGNQRIMLTERGTTFGYHNLIVDMRSLVIMRKFGYPVVMDATHSVQLPGAGNTSGGNPQFIPALARAAAAVGIDALFLEVHPDPSNALSDASSQFKLANLRQLLTDIKKIDRVVKNY